MQGFSPKKYKTCETTDRIVEQVYYIIYSVMSVYPLKKLPSGHIFLDPSDDCLAAARALDQTGYTEDFCLALDFDPWFIARLMAAGFLVMSCALEEPANKSNDTASAGNRKFKNDRYILLPKHHLERSCLFFPELHIKKKIRSKLSGYELRFDQDFDTVLDKCIATHGDDWLTEPLVNLIREIRRDPGMPVKPVSFGLYREGCLKAGEFGIMAGNVYTSYSGYYDESNTGTIQMILTAQYLEKTGHEFWDLGMPLDYKLTLGAREIPRKQFMALLRVSNM